MMKRGTILGGPCKVIEAVIPRHQLSLSKLLIFTSAWQLKQICHWKVLHKPYRELANLKLVVPSARVLTTPALLT